VKSTFPLQQPQAYNHLDDYRDRPHQPLVNTLHRCTDWLETHWATPAYSGWLLLCLTFFFFGAATNTLAGWLYVLSGVLMALLILSAIVARRNLQGLRVQRSSIVPVSAGEHLIVELKLQNRSLYAKQLIQLHDHLPIALGKPTQTVIEAIPPQGEFHWIYNYATSKRGIYRWQTVQLRTASPFGLMWQRRVDQAIARSVVYPTVLPLTTCPLLDQFGQASSLQISSHVRHSRLTADGLTRSLRPYRWGDSMRLVHWRTSARYGTLQVRELENFTGGQDIIICLDSASSWDLDVFEQAVTATASLYFYARHHNLTPQLWTAGQGLLNGNTTILETLAAIMPNETLVEPPPTRSLIWLTQTAAHLNMLPSGSYWILWSLEADRERFMNTDSRGIIVNPELSLQLQLQ
jgi:uncharacterized protein (DUF58 family)